MVVALRPLGSQDTRAATAQSLERLTVTAVRADAAPIPRTTLERAQIERDYSGQDLPLTLRLAPSVTAYSESGSLLNYSYFRVRGIDQSRVNITLDGIPLNEPEDQQIYFSDFPDLASSIQSMQVQRGVGTSTYGQAALGGSVNFATHSLTGAPRGTTTGGGSFGWREQPCGTTVVHWRAGCFTARCRGCARTGIARRDVGCETARCGGGYYGDRDLVKFPPRRSRRNGQTYAAPRRAAR
jgi:iron complex outermembrane receptor protein